MPIWVLYPLPFLALGALGMLCYIEPKVLVGLAFLAVIHLPIVCCLIWGSEEEKEAIYKYHPPGHE